MIGDTSDTNNLKKALISDLPTGGGGLANVVEDLSPQLGGNLDPNTFLVGAASAADLTKLAAVTSTSAELNYTDGVTSALQGQIDATLKSGGPLDTPSSGTLTNCTGYTAANLPSSIDAIKIANGTVTNTEFQYLDGTTSALQGQIDAKASITYVDTISGNTQSGTTYSLVAGDSGLEVRTTNAAVKTVTIDNTAALGTGFVCSIANLGVGRLVLAPGSGVTLRTNIWKIPQYGRVIVEYIGTDEYLIDTPKPDAIVLLTDGATIATDCALGTRFRVTIAGDRTLSNPTSPQDGFQYTWEIISDGTAGRDLALGAKFVFGSDVTAFATTATANIVDYLTAIYNLAADEFRVVGVSKGY